MKKILSKKGQVSTIGPSVIALVIAGVFLILGLVILQEIRDTDLLTNAASETVNNETITGANQNDTFEVDRSSKGGFGSFTVLYLTNETDGATIPSSNYTVLSNGITLTDNGMNNTNVNITYSYSSGGVAYEQSNGTLTGMATFADFWEIIVLAIVITVVIGLLLVVFGNSRTR